ncbi:MAG: serpin family protein [Bacteroidales bacterium]|jgi:serpin B
MKRHCLKTILALTAGIPVLFTMCSKSTDQNLPTEPVKISLSQTQVSIVESGSSFAFDIFRNVVENADKDENIMVSPLSISYALSMTLNGANGATRDSMLAALRDNGLTPDEINNSFKGLTTALMSVDKRVAMLIANSVWTEIDFAVKKSFIDILTNYYNAESQQFDINDPTVPGKVNAWISNSTNGLITNMLDKLDTNTVMLLINAIYFKGKWTLEFDPANTMNTSFYKPEGTTVSVPVMSQSSDFKVYNGGSFILGEFPYGQGNFVMDVILPTAQDGIGAFIPSLTQSAFNGWINQLSSQKVDLSMPRFKYGYKITLNDILSDMGMGIAFTPFADFSNIADASLCISKVLHQSYIETDEEGTEAAAATIVTIIPTAVEQPFEFNINHSFIYIIRETTTGSILFMGRVADPSAN